MAKGSGERVTTYPDGYVVLDEFWIIVNAKRANAARMVSTEATTGPTAALSLGLH